VSWHLRGFFSCGVSTALLADAPKPAKHIAEKRYDAFLSHKSNDKPQVLQIASALKEKYKLDVWLDKWNLIRGAPCQQDIEH
jgi:hypothetical protein